MLSGNTSLSAAPWPGGSGRRFFADRLGEFSNRIAVVAESGATLSYRELAACADAFGASLSGSRKLLIVETLNQLPPLVVYLGALRGRHPVILVEDGATKKDRRILETFQPHAVFRRHGSDWRLELQSPSCEVELHEDLAVLLSTSGSTGSAKLVRLSHENIGTNAQAIAEYLQLSPAECAITSLPFHYSYGMSVVNSHLAAGASLLLTDASVTSPGFWDYFRAHGGTSFAGVPHTFDLLDRMQFWEKAWPTLRSMTQAGGRMAPEKVLAYARWASDRGVRFHVMYGQTEAAPRMAYVPPELLLENADCIGQAIPGGSFKLRDESGAEVLEPDEVGELVYSGPNVMQGYALDRKDLARGGEVSELLTGDLACRNHRGLFRIVGRKSRFSKILGLRISLDEVEAFLARNGIAAVAAGDDRSIAVCTLEAGMSKRIAGLLQSQYGLGASAFMVLERDEYPILPSGKLDYRAMLREADAPSVRQDTGDDPGGAARPKTPALRDMFRRVLGTKDVHPSDSFVTLGGDSISYVEITLAIEERLGYLPQNWERTPVHQLERLGRRRKPLPGLQTEVVLRVLSILGVLWAHATELRFVGGSDVLMILAGYSFACYQKTRLYAGSPGPVILQYLRKVILPYYLVTLAFVLCNDGVLGLKRLVWIATVYYHPLPITHLWFLQVLFHAVIIYSALFMIPPFRKWARAHPWSNGCAILAAGVAMHIFAGDIKLPGLYNHYTLQRFYLFAFGWCLQFAVTRSQKAVMVAFAMLLGFIYLPGIHNLSRFVWVLGATILMVCTHRIVIPGKLHGPMTLLARASFYIYILQFLPIDLDDHPTKHAWQVPIVMGEAILLGIAAWWVVRLLDRDLSNLRAVRPHAALDPR